MEHIPHFIFKTEFILFCLAGIQCFSGVFISGAHNTADHKIFRMAGVYREIVRNFIIQAECGIYAMIFFILPILLDLFCMMPMKSNNHI